MNLAELYASLPTQDSMIRRNAESMKLFERDGVIHYGKWRQWKRLQPIEAKKMLEDFRERRETHRHAQA